MEHLQQVTPSEEESNSLSYSLKQGLHPAQSLIIQLQNKSSFHSACSPFGQRNSMSHHKGFPSPLYQIWAERTLSIQEGMQGALWSCA